MLAEPLWSVEHNEGSAPSPETVRLVYARARSLGQKIGVSQSLLLKLRMNFRSSQLTI
jgi:hypothetical protein